MNPVRRLSTKPVSVIDKDDVWLVLACSADVRIINVVSFFLYRSDSFDTRKVFVFRKDFYEGNRNLLDVCFLVPPEDEGTDVRTLISSKVETVSVHSDVNIYTVSLNISDEVPDPVFRILGTYLDLEEIQGISPKIIVLGVKLKEKVTLLIRKIYSMFCFPVSSILSVTDVFFVSISVFSDIILDYPIVSTVNWELCGISSSLKDIVREEAFPRIRLLFRQVLFGRPIRSFNNRILGNTPFVN